MRVLHVGFARDPLQALPDDVDTQEGEEAGVKVPSDDRIDFGTYGLEERLSGCRLNSESNAFSCRGMLTSSSHIGRIQQFGSGLQHFGDSFVREGAVAVLDFLGGHSLRKARQYQSG